MEMFIEELKGCSDCLNFDRNVLLKELCIECNPQQHSFLGWVKHPNPRQIMTLEERLERGIK